MPAKTALTVLLLACAAGAHAQSPYRVRDVFPGPESSEVQFLARAGQVAVFSAKDAAHGEELWRSDGTREGTFLLADLVPGPDWSSPFHLTTVGDAVYFVAGRQLWKTDGSVAGTTLVREWPTGNPTLQELTASGPTLFFRARTAAEGDELWKSDGTTAGTVLVRDIFPGAFSSGPHSLTAVAGGVIFAAQGPSGGVELWKSDGTAAGTVMVRDVNPGGLGSSPVPRAVLGPLSFFTANVAGLGVETWVTDGTTAGTRLLRDLNPGPPSSQPTTFGVSNGSAYFWATEPATGRELYRSDGTAEGTVLVADLAPGPASSTGGRPVEVGATTMFVTAPGTGDDELYRTDGTAAGTVRVADMNPSGGSSGSPLGVLAGVLYLSAFDDAHGQELWRSDGTEAGTQLVRDLNPGPDGSEPYLALAIGERLTFVATDGSSGWEPWAVDAGGPTVDAGPDVAVAVGEAAPLEGTAVDPEGDSLAFAWLDAGDMVLATGASATVTLPPGAHVVTLVASDGPHRGSDSTVVTVGERLQLAVVADAGGDGRIDTDLGESCVGTDGAGAVCPFYYAAGTVVTLTATAAEGSTFVGWNGACSGTGACQVTMDAAQSVEAVFLGPAFLYLMLEGAQGGAGAVRVEPPDALCEWPDPCPYSVARGTVVTLTPLPAAGSSFGGWNGTHCAGVAGTCTLVAEEFAELTARFVGQRSLRLDVGGTGGGQGSVSVAPPSAACAMGAPDTPLQCSYFYAADQTVTLTPTAAAGSGFAGWTGACTGTGPCTVAVDGHEVVGATFEGPRDLTLQLSSIDGVGFGSVTIEPPGSTCVLSSSTGATCGESYAHGSTVTLTPHPAPGAAFDRWAGDGSCSGTGPCTLTMGAHRSVTAIFAGPRRFRVEVWGEEDGQGSIVLSPGGGTCAVPAPNTFVVCEFFFLQGEVVTVTPVPAPGSRLEHWFGDCTGNGPCAVTIGAASSVRASFYGPPKLLVRVDPRDGASGTIRLDPPGSTCTNPTPGLVHTCTSSYPFDTVVTLTASAPPGSAFYGWSDGVCVGAGTAPCAVTMDATKFASAIFVPGNHPPSLAVTSPAAGASFVAPATVTMAADASDADGTVVRVEFFEGTTSRGADTTAPYAVTWSNVAAGVHALMAVATDDRGATTTVPFTVTVSARVSASADAYVRDGEPNANFGFENALHVRRVNGQNHNRWTYLRISTAALSSVSAARLRLFGHLVDVESSPVNALAYPVASTTWNEATIRWNNRPATGATPVAAAALDTATTGQRWYEWDLTAYVQAEKAAGRHVISLAIRNDVVTSGRAAFRSREASQNRPELLLTP